MLEVNTSGIDAYVSWLRAEMKAIKKEVRLVFREWALTIHADITDLTPQWSGNLAANWVVEIGGTSQSALAYAGPVGDQPYKPLGRGGQGPIYSRGMDPAVSFSIARAQALRTPLLWETVYIHNPVEYAQKVEDDATLPRVRAINRLPREDSGKIAMVYHAAVKYDKPLPKARR